MALVVRKIGTETWREAVARRASASDLADICLAAFDAACAAGMPEHIAAYRALDSQGCLDRVMLPGDSQKEPDKAESDQIEPPGS